MRPRDTRTCPLRWWWTPLFSSAVGGPAGSLVGKSMVFWRAPAAEVACAGPWNSGSGSASGAASASAPQSTAPRTSAVTVADSHRCFLSTSYLLGYGPPLSIGVLISPPLTPTRHVYHPAQRQVQIIPSIAKYFKPLSYTGCPLITLQKLGSKPAGRSWRVTALPFRLTLETPQNIMKVA